MAHSHQPACFRITFVCSGNICRSPMAEVVLRALATQYRLSHRLLVDSAGTADWHVGEPADQRTLAALRAAGYDGSAHRAKQFDVSQFVSSDLIVYFDNSHQRMLHALANGSGGQQKLQSLLSFDPGYAELSEVPDPYYADDETFDRVLEVIEQCCRSLFRQLAPALQAA